MRESPQETTFSCHPGADGTYFSALLKKAQKLECFELKVVFTSVGPASGDLFM